MYRDGEVCSGGVGKCVMYRDGEVCGVQGWGSVWCT